MLSTHLISIACERARSVRGDKKGWTAHLIGANKCLYASDEARDCARKANGTEIVTSSKHARSSSAADASHQLHKQFKCSGRSTGTEKKVGVLECSVRSTGAEARVRVLRCSVHPTKAEKKVGIGVHCAFD